MDNISKIETKEELASLENEFAAVLTRAFYDEKLECFLETVTPEDVRFYEKYNFKVIHNKAFAENQQFWIMKRPSS